LYKLIRMLVVLMNSIVKYHCGSMLMIMFTF